MEYVLLEKPDGVCLAGETRWSMSCWRDPMEYVLVERPDGVFLDGGTDGECLGGGTRLTLSMAILYNAGRSFELSVLGKASSIT